MRLRASHRGPAALDVAEELRFRGLADDAAADERVRTIPVDADAQPGWPGRERWPAGRRLQEPGAALHPQHVFPLRVTAGLELGPGGELDGPADRDGLPGQVPQAGDRRRER